MSDNDYKRLRSGMLAAKLPPAEAECRLNHIRNRISDTPANTLSTLTTDEIDAMVTHLHRESRYICFFGGAKGTIAAIAACAFFITTCGFLLHRVVKCFVSLITLFTKRRPAGVLHDAYNRGELIISAPTPIPIPDHTADAENTAIIEAITNDPDYDFIPESIGSGSTGSPASSSSKSESRVQFKISL